MRRIALLFILLLATWPCMAGGFLKQSTAVTLKLGPFVDDTDFTTEETGLTISQGDIQISKAGAAFAQTSDGTPTTTHDANGWYPIPLTTTDTNTLGTITVRIHESGALPVWWHGMVLPANAYDAVVGGTDYLQTDATQIEGSDATDTLGTAQTGDSYARLGAPAGASISADVAAVKAETATILADTEAQDTSAELRTLLYGSDTAGATAAAQTTAQNDLDTITGADGTTLATSQGNYAPLKPTTAGRTLDVTTTGEAGVDLDNMAGTLDAAEIASAELRTLLYGSDTAGATAAAQTTAQNDLDTITGADGATLATSQPNYAPMLATEDGSSFTVIPWNASWDSEAQSEVNDALVAFWTSPANLVDLFADEPLAGHTTEDTIGKEIADASAASDPWSTALPGAYGAGTAGYILGTNLDAKVSSVAGGAGDTPVNHDTGGTDALAYKTAGGAGIDGASIYAYVKSEYDAGTFTVRGTSTTNALGRWTSNMMLNTGVEYTLVFYKPGQYGPDEEDVTP